MIGDKERIEFEDYFDSYEYKEFLWKLDKKQLEGGENKKWNGNYLQF